jgi:mRNA (2'-O-methyladenosine-N6-)-methyltransferase
MHDSVKVSYAGEEAVPICADVTNFNFDLLVKKQLEVAQGLFDVIMMDPPWKLSTSQPSRGVAIQYDSLSDEYIEQIPVPKLQKSGVLLVWAINAKYAFTVKIMEQWGYRLVDSITWVKKTVNGKIAKGHGYYLQHAKETCLIGVKGDPPKLRHGVARDVIFSERRGQSQKPQEVYDYIE